MLWATYIATNKNAKGVNQAGQTDEILPATGSKVKGGEYKVK